MSPGGSSEHRRHRPAAGWQDEREGGLLYSKRKTEAPEASRDTARTGPDPPLLSRLQAFDEAVDFAAQLLVLAA